MKQKGFTLIELVIVIIIVGILAVIAIPKFVNLQRDARIADLKGIEASLKSANALVYSKAATKGIEDLEYDSYLNPTGANLIIDGKKISLHYGHVMGTAWNVSGILNVSKKDWNIRSTAGIFSITYITPKSAPAFAATNASDIEASQCYLAYGFTRMHYKAPIYSMVTSGC